MHLSEAQEAVRDFHIKNNYPFDIAIDWKCHKNTRMTWLMLFFASSMLYWTYKILEPFAKHYQKEKHDGRLYRACLAIEELQETIAAMRRRDELEVADGLGDQLYILLGTCVNFNIPIEEVFLEVHRANMSKKAKAENDERMRDKGDWIPPNIEAALATGKMNIVKRSHGKSVPESAKYIVYRYERK